MVEKWVGKDIAGHPVWNIRSKTPQTVRMTVPWHQDTAYLNEGAEKTLQIAAWIPLVDVNENNGTLQLVSKYKDKVLNHNLEKEKGDSKSWYLYIDDNDFNNESIYTCNFKVGTIILFNQIIPHRSLENHSDHIISLNNPCLTREDIQNGFFAMKEKDYTNGFRICFAGQCVPTKGIFKLLATINILADNTMFAGCTIAGNGDENELRMHLNQEANQITTFSGILSRQDLNQIYAESHFILLPSQSEGFPKVLAEAAAFGCVPITSNLPGFDKIIKNEVDGILLDDLSTENIYEKLTVAWADQSKMKKIANQAHQWSKEFSYNFFIQNINTILGAS